MGSCGGVFAVRFARLIHADPGAPFPNSIHDRLLDALEPLSLEVMVHESDAA